MRTRLSHARIAVVVLAFAVCQTAMGDLSANLAARYTFTGNADDSSGYGNQGIVYGASLTMDRFGNPDSAYSFDGVNDYIDCGNGPSTLFDFRDSFTLEAWVKYSGLPTLGAIVARSDDRYATFNYHMGVAHGKFVAMADQAHIGSYWLLSDSELVEDVWYHLAYVYDNKSMTLYINGQEEGHAVFRDAGSGDPIAHFYIGNTGQWPGYADNRYFNGVIDEVAVYNRALTAGEVHGLSVVPVPGTTILGSIGLAVSGWMCRRKQT